QQVALELREPEHLRQPLQRRRLVQRRARLVEQGLRRAVRLGRLARRMALQRAAEHREGSGQPALVLLRPAHGTTTFGASYAPSAPTVRGLAAPSTCTRTR